MNGNEPQFVTRVTHTPHRMEQHFQTQVNKMIWQVTPKCLYAL